MKIKDEIIGKTIKLIQKDSFFENDIVSKQLLVELIMSSDDYGNVKYKSFTEVSIIFNASKPTIYRKIKKLEKNNYISLKSSNNLSISIAPIFHKYSLWMKRSVKHNKQIENELGETASEMKSSKTKAVLKKQKTKYNEIDKQIVEEFFELMKLNTTKAIRKPKESDYNTMRLMREKDLIDPLNIATIMRWSQHDEFWKSNIRSVAKLREHYSALEMRAMSDYNKQQRNRTVKI